METGLVGANSLVQTPIGLLSVDTALSGGPNADLGWSVAGELAIDTDDFWETLGSLQVGMDVMSADFMSNLSQVPAAGGRVRVSGAFSQPLPAGYSASLSGYYQLAEMEGDRGFGASVSMSSRCEQRADNWRRRRIREPGRVPGVANSMALAWLRG